jgi:hypothetical protein
VLISHSVSFTGPSFPSRVEWVFKPAVKAPYAKVDCLISVHLLLQLLLVQSLHQTNQAIDLGSDILVEILLGDDGWLRVGDGIDPDEVVIAPTRMDLNRAVLAM